MFVPVPSAVEPVTSSRSGRLYQQFRNTDMVMCIRRSPESMTDHLMQSEDQLIQGLIEEEPLSEGCFHAHTL